MSVRIGIMFILLLCAVCLAPNPPAAEAGIWDAIKGVFRIPGEVEDLREGYDRMQERYSEVQNNLLQTRRELEDKQAAIEESALRAEEQMRQYEELQQAMAEENALLRQYNESILQQNEEMARQIAVLEKAEQERGLFMRKVTRVGLTAIGLTILYFVLWRFVRFGMRHADRQQTAQPQQRGEQREYPL